MKTELKITAMQLAFVAALIAVAYFVAGCMSITVEDFGREVVRDLNGAPIVANDGTVQTIHKGQRWSYFKHWENQSCEQFNFSRKPGDEIEFAASNYQDEVSAELNKLVETSLTGAAELAAMVGAAIASCGASTAGEAGASALSKAISSYIAKGGNVANAKIDCKDGNCTISDGIVTESCENCIER